MAYKGEISLKRMGKLARQRMDKDYDLVYAITGDEGCLSGDTIINCNRASLGRKFTIKKMYREFHQREYNNGKAWNLDIPTYVRSYNNKSIQLHKIDDVVYSGKKEVWLLKLEDGKEIKATKDHKIMTNRGWIELQYLKDEDKIMCDTLKPQMSEPIFVKFKSMSCIGIEDTYDIICEDPYHNFVANGMVVHNSGKSTLADQLGKEIDPKFSITKNTVTAIEFDKIKSTALDPKVKVLIFDEAIKSFYKLTWASKLQVSLNRLFSTVRQERKCFMLCIPRFTDLSEFFRNHRCKIWIHIDKRGLGLVFMKSRNFFAKSGWNMEDYEKRTEKWVMRRGEQYTINELVDFLNKEVPIFMGYILFNPLSPEEKEEYNSVIAQAKYEGIEADLKNVSFGRKSEEYLIARERLGLLLKRFRENQIPLLKEYPLSTLAHLIDGDKASVVNYIKYYDNPESKRFGQPKLVKHDEPSREPSQDVHVNKDTTQESVHDFVIKEDDTQKSVLNNDSNLTTQKSVPEIVKVNTSSHPIIYNNNRSTKNSTKPLSSRHSSDFVYQNTKKKPKKVKK